MKETRIVNYPTKKNFKKAMVATALGLSLAMGTTSVPVLNNVATVEAASKKDRKKPKIKFSGKKQLEVTEGEKVTIPKTTYSDNQTKKKKLKVGVTVKKGNKNYKSIANKIKSATVKNKPVTVTFDEEGTYKITTTVTDLSKNKATAVRYVTVNDKEDKKEEEIVTRVNPEPIVTPTPEEPAKTVITETPVTEEPKKEEKATEEPKKEEKTTEQESEKEEDTQEEPITEEEDEPTISDDLASLSYVKQVKVGDNTFNVTNSVAYMYDLDYNPNLNYKIGFETNCSGISFKYDQELMKNCEVLKYLGKPVAYDEEGNDISDRILIYETFSVSKAAGSFDMIIAVTDGDYGYNYITIPVGIFDVNKDFSQNVYENYIKINDNPIIYIYPEEPVLSANKKLVLESN